MKLKKNLLVFTEHWFHIRSILFIKQLLQSKLYFSETQSLIQKSKSGSTNFIWTEGSLEQDKAYMEGPFSIHVLLLFWGWVTRQQIEWGHPHFPLPGHFLQLLREPRSIPGPAEWQCHPSMSWLFAGVSSQLDIPGTTSENACQFDTDATSAGSSSSTLRSDLLPGDRAPHSIITLRECPATPWRKLLLKLFLFFWSWPKFLDHRWG